MNTTQIGIHTLKTPCPSCPWRVDQTAEAIPGFCIDKAEALVACSPDERGRGPDFSSPMFACHLSSVGKEMPCAGWLAQVGHAHPRVRLAVLTDRLPPENLKPGKDWPALHDNYSDVLRKLRASSS